MKAPDHGDPEHLEQYILFLIRTTKLINAKTIFFRVSREYSPGLRYEDIMERLKSLKSARKIEPVVMDERKTNYSTLWRLKE